MTSLPNSAPGSLRRAVRRARRLARRRGGLRANLRAVAWARRAAEMLPDHTHAARLVGLVVPPPSGLPLSATPSIERALADSGVTCLQRCLVLQTWLAAHGEPFEVAIGVRTADGFEAHAWIPGYHGESEHEGFDEIARVPLVGDRLRPAAP